MCMPPRDRARARHATHLSSVLLPLPVLPTTASVQPPGAVNDTPRSTGEPAGP